MHLLGGDHPSFLRRNRLQVRERKLKVLEGGQVSYQQRPLSTWPEVVMVLGRNWLEAKPVLL